MVQPSFVLLCKPLDFAGHNVHLQVSVEVVSIVPGFIDHVPEYFVLKSLYNIYMQPQSWMPYVHTGFSICLYMMSLLFRDSEEFLPINEYIFCILGPVPLVSF